jgi:hypothetical protein
LARDKALPILVSHSILLAIICLPGAIKSPLELIYSIIICIRLLPST